jgi:hypothetical protein
MKKCFKCGIEKDLSEFYKHKRMGDGHLNKCKLCAKGDVKENYSKNLKDPSYMERERKRGREKYNRLYRSKVYRVFTRTETGIAKSKRECILSYIVKFPEKNKAKIACQRIKPPKTGLEKHHWSYNEEHYKDLVFITKKQHMKAHRFIVYDQERMMYRRYDTNELLDTKEKHESFIFYCIEHEED